ncbi:pyocin knob domain-containing protein [Lentilactobacillus buchneri subsp. silagei]|uniref:pyocin knob domain-containing protein n=1 Tax=Lentilactobacillus buchneri TaxID=1581 RepID=UPI003AFA8EAF
MSKELAFTDDNDVVKYLDTTTAFNLALTADGVAFDLTNAKSILVKIANDDGYIMQQTIDLTTVTSPLGGTLSFPINQNIMNTLVPDDYDIEVWVTMNDGTQAIFPSDGTLGFSIEENLMSDTGEVIPTITLNDFQQQFDDLSSQMENAVHNVQKGDQGNPGNGIKAANNQYQLNDSPVTVPTGGWSDTILATTDQLPYLWTKIIFIYDDGTTKETNFVSSRGDTGSQGPIGPVGPQGKQGNGLVVRGKADKEENLPTTGNNQGDGYLVGTDLYIWIDDSWQNMGSITPDLADYVKVTDMNNALSAKADDSKVVHTVDAPSSIIRSYLTTGTDLNTVTQPGIFPFDQCTFVNDINNATKWGAIVNNVLPNQVTWQEMIQGNGQIYGYRIYNGGSSTWSNWLIPADDSKVAHLSGANNFDTVPTVNNNPLLLASSLPSDIARTGSDQEFTGKNTFDTAPIDKTTGNPYITKDGVPAVPSTLADTTKLANFTDGLQKSGKDVATTADVTSAVNSATANAVTTNKLANFTAGLQSGGVDVATVGVSVGDIYPMDPTDSLNIGSGLITITNVTDKNISGKFKLSALMVCDQMSGLAVPSFPDKFTKNISITIASNNVQSVGNDVNGGTYTIVNLGKGILGFSPRPTGGSSSNAEVLYGTASGTFTCDV